MPSTVNGIGTHYYGKQNVQVRQGVCQSCHDETTLSSYNTRLWFVIVFIPIIPLGRKRIMDKCSRCQRHWAAQADEWEMSRQLQISGAMERFRSQPTPEVALEVHGSLLSFHQHDEATRLRDGVLEQFPDSASLRAGLASHLEQTGNWAGATPLYEAAFSLNPDDPAARSGVAVRHIQTGMLDEARELLDFLDKPGSSQLYSLEPLDQLAGAMQTAGRHEEAVQLCERLLSELPEIGKSAQFRKFVLKSEKLAGREQTILPMKEFSLRGLFRAGSGQFANWQRQAAIGAVIAAVVIFAASGLNEYWRRNRDLHVVSSFAVPALISIDGAAPVSISQRGTIRLAEGTHRAVITGAIEDEVSFEVRTGYFERFSSDPVWLLNVGGDSVLIDEKIFYAVVPVEPQRRVVFGTKFEYFAHVDYPFTQPPQTLQVDSKKRDAVTKTHLELVTLTDEQRISAALSQLPPDVGFPIAERRLASMPETVMSLEGYVQAAQKQHQEDRAERFFQSGLERQPVSIVWHRAYSNLRDSAASEAKLVEYYDQRLKSDPQNGALLYLRGRVTPQCRESREYFQQSAAAQPDLGWPWFALGGDAVSRGEWVLADEYLAKAKERNMDPVMLDSLSSDVQLALGRAVPLEHESRAKLKSEDFRTSLVAMLNLADALATQEQVAAAQSAISIWEQQRTQDGSGVEPYKASLRGYVEYMCGNFAAVPQSTVSFSHEGGPAYFHALLATNRFDEALAIANVPEAAKDGWLALAMSAAYSVAFDTEHADVWRETACVILEQGKSDDLMAASLLRRAEPPTQNECDEVMLSFNQKRTFLLALVAKYPTQRELAEMLKTLNVSRMPPYHLCQAALRRAK